MGIDESKLTKELNVLRAQVVVLKVSLRWLAATRGVAAELADFIEASTDRASNEVLFSTTPDESWDTIRREAETWARELRPPAVSPPR